MSDCVRERENYRLSNQQYLGIQLRYWVKKHGTTVSDISSEEWGRENTKMAARLRERKSLSTTHFYFSPFSFEDVWSTDMFIFVSLSSRRMSICEESTIVRHRARSTPAVQLTNLAAARGPLTARENLFFTRSCTATQSQRKLRSIKVSTCSAIKKEAEFTFISAHIPKSHDRIHHVTIAVWVGRWEKLHANPD